MACIVCQHQPGGTCDHAEALHSPEARQVIKEMRTFADETVPYVRNLAHDIGVPVETVRRILRALTALRLATYAGAHCITLGDLWPTVQPGHRHTDGQQLLVDRNRRCPVRTTARRLMKIGAPDWKPTACADCGAPWPSFSLQGQAGPWRCGACNLVARANWTPSSIPQPACVPDRAGQQGLLL
jgi:hypothetical protein